MTHSGNAPVTSPSEFFEIRTVPKTQSADLFRPQWAHEEICGRAWALFVRVRVCVCACACVPSAPKRVYVRGGLCGVLEVTEALQRLADVHAVLGPNAFKLSPPPDRPLAPRGPHKSEDLQLQISQEEFRSGCFLTGHSP